MSYIVAFFQHKDVRRFGILALFCLILFLLRSMLNIMLLTFLFAFLMNRIHSFVYRQVSRVVPVNPKLILSLLYALLVGLLVLGGFKLFPALINQTGQIIDLVKRIGTIPQDSELARYLVSFLNTIDIQGMVKHGLDFVMKISNWGLHLFLALLLSLFLLLGKENVIRFTRQFRTSKLGWLFNEVEFFGKKFIHTFGKVIEAQLLIALINCIVTTLALKLMGFPNLFVLSLLVFVLGLIPVAGVFLSLIPLCAIAYSIGGLLYIVYLLITITIIHALEAYVLNPRLMASKTNLPMFFTFIVLLFSEHFFGVWGLIVGIPTFVFLLDILEVQAIGKPKSPPPAAPADRSGN
ncbi:AI-2E family transporter [Paenibacillus ginsengarvi]|uniref:AI-2E family transporter n=1 Tax=Paenibacillus ginsengarvi TaxID=400777 RepID=A0A3B0CM89_9BACL|nr:AI-2E family transporter [Paenibacillus ginsengarvi]RKN86795.1 AI-2E family transporter [Paenibacillus ginsengarvi]